MHNWIPLFKFQLQKLPESVVSRPLHHHHHHHHLHASSSFCRPQLLLSTSTFHSFLAIDATQPISPFVTNSTHTDQFMLRHQCKWCTMCIAHGVLLKWSYKCIQSVRCTLHSQVSSTDYWSNYLLKKLATVLVLPQAHEPIKFCSGAGCSGSHFPNSFQTYFTILDNLVRNE